MAKITIRATLHVAWWWKCYVCGVQFLSDVTGLAPDPEKIGYWAKRAVTIRFSGGKR